MENFDRSPSLFAIMTPANNAARDAFSQVAQKMRENKGWNPNARRNIDAKDQPVQVSTYGDEDESDSGTGPSRTLRPVLTGCYTFDLNVPPKTPALGWMIGGGNFGKEGECPEILLTEKKTKAGVSARHARLAHNFASGALVLSALDTKLIHVNGHDLVDEQCVIHRRTTCLRFGGLMYNLEVRNYPMDALLRDHLRVYKGNHGIPDDDYPLNLRATSADCDMVLQKYILKNAVGRGATGVVYAGHTQSSGDAVAVKKIVRTVKNAKAIAQDIAISRYIGKHRRICSLIDVIDPTVEDPTRGYKAFEVDEVFLVYMPLASATIQHILDAKLVLDARTREEIFWQLLEGIEYLHSIKIMHRDIKPLNLAVVSMSKDRPEARLIDFGLAQHRLKSDEAVGTSSYIAPEVWAIEEGRTNHKYTEKVDIFAFGLSMYQFFCQQPCDWDRVDKDEDGDISNSILCAIGMRLMEKTDMRALMDLILSFLNWNPQHRTSAEDSRVIRRGILWHREKIERQRAENDTDGHREKGKERAEDDTDGRDEDEDGSGGVKVTRKEGVISERGYFSCDQRVSCEGLRTLNTR